MTWTQRDALAEALCDVERGRKGTGYFIRHGRQADLIIEALAARDLELAPTNCSECGRYLDLRCSVHGERQWLPEDTEPPSDNAAQPRPGCEEHVFGADPDCDDCETEADRAALRDNAASRPQGS
jgi:hypothetical protein